MARNTGTFDFPANFEVNKLGPLDARTVTPLACELTDSSLPFAYHGMLVSVTDDTTANNGLYMLSATDATCVDNWQRIGSGSGGSGTVTGSTAGALLSTNNNSTCIEFGIDSGALDYLDQSSCLGLNTVGTVEGVTTGSLLSGGGNSGCFNIGIDSGALNYLDQSSCAGLNCIGDVVTGDLAGLTDCLGTVTCVTTTGDYLTGGGNSNFNIGIDSACASKWDNTAAGGILGVTTNSGLSGGGASGCVTIGIDSGTLTPLDQSSCPGINAVGTVEGVTTSTLLSGGGNSGCFNIGVNSGALTYLDQSSCSGIDCEGTVTCVTATGPLLSGGGNSNVAIGINSGALDYLNQSACPGIDCEGTIQGVTTTGDYLTGGGTSGCFNVGLDSACAAKWDNASAGGVTNVTGGDGITSSGGTTPEIAVDSSVARTDVAETFQNNVTVQGELSVSCAATLGGGVTIGNAQTIKLPSAAGTVYALDKVFTGVVGTGGTTITTFTKADLKSVKYDVTLVQGTNVTAFEIIAAYNGTDVSGSVYAIADAQDDSQLDDVEITSTGTTIDLVITSAANTTTATIFGKAKY